MLWLTAEAAWGYVSCCSGLHSPLACTTYCCTYGGHPSREKRVCLGQQTLQHQLLTLHTCGEGEMLMMRNSKFFI